MNLFKINFSELYERHLCRHSQYGINVVHTTAVVGIYLALAGILRWIIGSEWLLLCFIVPHLILIAFNIPVRVFVGCIFFMTAFFTLFLFIPKPSIWIDILAIPFFYKIQAWSHWYYNVAHDMTEFHKKFPKGFTFFLLLSFYELPLLLNYLIFDPNNWPIWLQSRHKIVTPVPSQVSTKLTNPKPDSTSTLLSSQP